MKVLKILNILDQCSRQQLGPIADTSINAKVAMGVLDDWLVQRGKPCFIRFDNGLEFIAEVFAG